MITLVVLEGGAVGHIAAYDRHVGGSWSTLCNVVGKVVYHDQLERWVEITWGDRIKRYATIHHVFDGECPCGVKVRICKWCLRRYMENDRILFDYMRTVGQPDID